MIRAPEIQSAAGVLLQPLRDALLVVEDVDRLPQQADMRLHEESVLAKQPVVLRRSLRQKAEPQIGAHSDR